jgi:hypothetical protein
VYSKFQRLKNTSNKLARVLLVDENPVKDQNSYEVATIRQTTTSDSLQLKTSVDSVVKSYKNSIKVAAPI